MGTVLEPVFRRLAERLDRFPQGFPATPDETELRILARIFTPEQAALALRLRPRPETPRAIARRIRRDEAEVADALAGMAAQGQILFVPGRGGPRYMLVPFVVGIYEFQLPRMDAELAELCEAYLPVLMRTMGAKGPPIARVIPALAAGAARAAEGESEAPPERPAGARATRTIVVGERFDARADVLPYEDLAAIIDEARSFRVMDCLCRKERGALGHPCTHPLETCLAISPHENGLTPFPAWGRVITREEARGVLELAEGEGLVHCTYNVQRNSLFVCNCCPCCCGFLRGVVQFNAPHLLLRASGVAHMDATACLSCGRAAAERCPTGALSATQTGAAAGTAEAARCTVDAARCIGCGLCALACPSGALALVPRPAGEHAPPPRGMGAWVLEREIERSGRIRGVGRLARFLLS